MATTALTSTPSIMSTGPTVLTPTVTSSANPSSLTDQNIIDFHSLATTNPAEFARTMRQKWESYLNEPRVTVDPNGTVTIIGATDQGTAVNIQGPGGTMKVAAFGLGKVGPAAVANLNGTSFGPSVQNSIFNPSFGGQNSMLGTTTNTNTNNNLTAGLPSHTDPSSGNLGYLLNQLSSGNGNSNNNSSSLFSGLASSLGTPSSLFSSANSSLPSSAQGILSNLLRDPNVTNSLSQSERDVINSISSGMANSFQFTPSGQLIDTITNKSPDQFRNSYQDGAVAWNKSFSDWVSTGTETMTEAQRNETQLRKLARIRNGSAALRSHNSSLSGAGLDHSVQVATYMHDVIDNSSMRSGSNEETAEKLFQDVNTYLQNNGKNPMTTDGFLDAANVLETDRSFARETHTGRPYHLWLQGRDGKEWVPSTQIARAERVAKYDSILSRKYPNATWDAISRESTRLADAEGGYTPRVNSNAHGIPSNMRTGSTYSNPYRNPYSSFGRRPYGVY